MEKRVFIKWLKDLGIYDQFIQNVKAYRMRMYLNSDVSSFFESLKEAPTNHYISRAFVWKSTPEGETFWNGVDNKWRRHVYDRIRKKSIKTSIY